MKKILLSIVLAFSFATISFGQEKTMESRAKKEVEKININITSVDPSAALSEKQKETMTAIYMEKFKALNELKNSNKSDDELKDERKAINLECNQNIYRNVFTPEQRIANKKGREKNKK